MRAIILTAIVLLLFSCKKIEVKPPAEGDPSPLSSPYHVYITNEGNFQGVNSSVSYYDPLDGEFIKDLYFKANGTALGDVCQSMTVSGGEAYIVVNNSSRIEVVNTSNFRKARTITQLTSPRYIAIKDGLGFVSDLYSNRLSVVNVYTGNIIKQIPIHGWTEELLIDSNLVYVTNLSNEYLYRININGLELKDSLRLGHAPASLVKDKNGKIWVLCQGDQFSSKPAELIRLNKNSFVVETRFSIPDGSSKLRIDATGSTIYFLGNGLNKLDVNGSWSGTSWIPADGRNLYGLGIDPFNGDVYVSDAHNYIQDGTIYHYNKDGSNIRTFKAGVIPGGFYFF